MLARNDFFQPTTIGYVQDARYRSSIDSYYDDLRNIQKKAPLLTGEEEILLSRQIQAWLDVERVATALAKELGRQPSDEEVSARAGFSPAEMRAIIRAGQRARERMILSNLRLVVAIAKKMIKKGASFNQFALPDMIQEGFWGLDRAIRKFDPSKGCKFSTYAYWWVAQSCQRYMQVNRSLVPLPWHIEEKIYRMVAKHWRYIQQHGKPPTCEQLAEMMGLEPEYVRRLWDWGRTPISLELRMGRDEDMTLGDYVLQCSDSLDTLGQQDTQEKLLTLLESCLPDEKMRQAISLRYGLITGDAMSVQEVADSLGISKASATLLLRAGLARLRKHARRSNELRDLFKEVAA